MDSLEDGEGFQHPSFLQMFFHANDQIVSTHDREDVVTKEREERDYSRRFWSNETFSFLFDKFEERYWESNMKLMKNWEAFVATMNNSLSR
jgi:hypothetical protein